MVYKTLDEFMNEEESIRNNEFISKEIQKLDGTQTAETQNAILNSIFSLIKGQPKNISLENLKKIVANVNLEYVESFFDIKTQEEKTRKHIQEIASKSEQNTKNYRQTVSLEGHINNIKKVYEDAQSKIPAEQMDSFINTSIISLFMKEFIINEKNKVHKVLDPPISRET